MQSSLLRLAGGLAERGVKVDVIIAGKLKGPLLGSVPANVRLISLARSNNPWWHLRRALRSLEQDGNGAEISVPLALRPPRAARYLPSIAHYMESERPDSLIVAGTIFNLVTLWARGFSSHKPRVIVCERNSISAAINTSDGRDQWKWRHAAQLVARTYPMADAIVANSHGVAADLAKSTGLPRDTIDTIYNPIVDDVLTQKAKEPVDHPWFAPGMPPVVLGVGRLHPQKDFPTLIKAFAQVRAQRDARLLIVGQDARIGVREDLISLATRLGVEKDVDMPGFAANPIALMARAGVFVLSSRFEGCPNVLVEAMATGCPVVSTRCPHGPDEILKDGLYGPLVEVGDDTAMAQSISATLEQPPDRKQVLERASDFGFAPAVNQYLALL